ncbi:hypothetical protein K435DRAFT_879478 [Dendrothele bispora CBS 962.96]|uniref:Uncharacterized protein n=1 Tax=Dendrothele bispora (strain CBS 962.96) TaxID=1314807 RepID=A0A4S8KM14_DENBC|nr:hypothetical protein K435DRAFT_879478 [Dendrothele bispora CBS 962.96]
MTPPQNNSNGKRGRGRPRKNPSSGTDDNPTQAAILARIQQLEDDAAARDAENARLRAQLTVAQQATSASQVEPSTDQSSGHMLCGMGEDRRPDEHPPVGQLFDGSDDEGGPRPRRRTRDENDDNPTIARANKRQRLQNLADQRANREAGGSTSERNHSNPNQTTAHGEDEHIKVPKPEGQAGKDYSLAVKMGLSRSTNSQRRYNALLRSMRDAVSESRIPWQREWAQIDAADKAMLFAIMRQRDPFLSRFENDWASEAMVRQYLKNKRKTAYKQGTLTAPSKYDYLKTNSAQRDQSKTRKRKAIQERRSKKKAEKEARRQRRENRRRLRRLSDRGEEEEEEFVQGSSRDGASAEDEDGGDIQEDGGDVEDRGDGSS